MSNALAIAAVTEALVQTLQAALTGINLGSTPSVTNFRPDQAGQLPEVGVNIFLYQIAPNSFRRNTDLPTRGTDGTLVQRPMAAIDLHYLLTFYGDDSKLEQQRLLGAVVRELHANPTLTRAAIVAAQQNTDFLSGSNLDQQPDLVRFTPVNFSLEELSKLWSFLLKTDYVLSTAYQASVVLIDAEGEEPPPPLPVLSPGIGALPFREPLVFAIRSAAGPDAPILPGGAIVITGGNFVLAGGGTTTVTIDGAAQAPSLVTDSEIALTLTPGLAAGMRTLQLVQALNLGTPALPHQLGFQSSPASFVLHPQIRQAGSPPGYVISVGPGAASPPGEALTVGVSPTVRAGQRGLLELLQVTQPSAARLFDGGVAATDTDQLTFQLRDLPSGTYLVRIRVDGAESPLDFDPSGAPVAPSVIL